MGPHENIQNLPERTGRKRWWGFIHPHNILLDNTEKKKQVEDVNLKCLLRLERPVKLF